MEKSNQSKVVSLKDVSCLENLVVAYNTVFLMSSIFLVYIASTAHELFSDINRLLSPSLLLPVVGVFVILLAGVGYVGIAKQSSTLISIYTQLLLFIFALEVAAGLGILSYRSEICAMISNKMKKSINAYPTDPFLANTVDYVQLELRCCGVTSYDDWRNVLDDKKLTECSESDVNIILPDSCCRKMSNSTVQINRRGCMNVLNLLLHKSSLLLSLAVLTISTIQILGAYFSFTLASNLRKLKIQSCTPFYNPTVQQQRRNK
ncbi:hypothetical protein RUM44_008482 [Polyplax serrata]|uniref:Tetraspanin n=1 Tax=Polyplax serrata TaxID=468196 RepID=A0ABR1BCK9_POLSC